MGEVYRARDTRLGREVALKVVLDAFAADADRVARLQREAKVLASLNHPHIAALYGIEEAAGQHFLVMELVEGQTLADRLLRGTMPVAETLALAIQIADALEAAHEKGVVHRDLKPANVKVTPDDKVKVLDFGLAKAVETPSTVASAANSPTLSMMASQAGVILGTAAYMAPEQAKGLPADHRSDVFSFGSVLFEMLSGRQPFQGDTAPDVMASVLVREPEFTRLPPSLDPRLVGLLRRCLEKQPKRRWQAIGDVRAELEAIAAAPAAASNAIGQTPPRPLWRRAWPAVASAVVVAALAGAAAWTLKPLPARPVVDFSIVLPSGQRFSAPGRRAVAISPDGTLIAFVAERRLNLRRIGAPAIMPIRGSENEEGVNSPAFSPDGTSIAFYSNGDGMIKRIAVGGGSAVPLCAALNPTGLSWDTTGIVFGQLNAEIRQVLRVPSSGGKPQVLVTLPPDEIPDGPEMLPGGDTIMFAAASARVASWEHWDKAQIFAQSISTGKRTLLVNGGSNPHYLAPGYLSYALGGTVYAVAFDLLNLKVNGDAVPILEGVRRAAAATTGMADFSVSANGDLAFVPGPASTVGGAALALIDWHGATTPLKLAPGQYASPRVEPHGTRIALEARDAKGAFIGVYDPSGTAGLRRITFEGNGNAPVWSPDGTRLAFQSLRDGDAAIFTQAADGSGAPQRLTRPAAGESHVPQSWGRRAGTDTGGASDVLLFDVVTPRGTALWQVSLRDGKASPFGDVHSSFDTGAVFSPDGRWVAYSVSLGPSPDLFVQPFPATGDRHMQVKATPNAPHHPTWSADGKVLTYVPAAGLIERVAVTTEPFAFGNPETAARDYLAGPPGSRRVYDMMADGRILGLLTPGQIGSDNAGDEIHVVLNWLEDRRPRLPR